MIIDVIYTIVAVTPVLTTLTIPVCTFACTILALVALISLLTGILMQYL
jgi:hypothetical protein